MKFACDNGHLVEIESKTPAKAIRMAGKMLIACPHCKPNNVRLTYIDEADGNFSGKQYICSGNHLTLIYPFTNGFCNVKHGHEHENIEATPKVMHDMIGSGDYKCGHTVEYWSVRGGKDPVLRTRRCNRKLFAVDDSPLSEPSVAGIKTRTRVGDIWDKAGCPEPKDASIQIETRGGKAYDARLNETEFSRRNRRRVKEMRRQTGQRNAKPAGEVIDKPTNRSYKEDRPLRPKKSEL